MSTDTVGGVWVYAIELALALRKYGIQIVLATMGERLSRAQRQQAAQVPDLILCESRWRLEWMASPWHDLACAGYWLLQLERRYRLDLIHLNHYCHGHLDWHAPCLVVGHSCVLSWWQGVFAEQAPASWNTYRRRVRRGLAGADAVVAPSRFMRAALERHYGTLRRSAVVYNGRVPAELSRGEETSLYPGRRPALGCGKEPGCPGRGGACVTLAGLSGG